LVCVNKRTRVDFLKKPNGGLKGFWEREGTT